MQNTDRPRVETRVILKWGPGMMIQVAIVEDDQDSARQVQEYLRRYQRETGTVVETVCFTDGDEIAENYRPRFDLIFMDIVMRFKDGMTAAREIRRLDPEVSIVFLTSMAQYAVESYEVGATDYLLKPLAYPAFRVRLDRLLAKLERRRNGFITVPVKGGFRKLDISRILFVESRDHELTFHTGGETVTSSLPMREAEERLGRYGFFRGNNSYLINLAHVEGVQDGCALVDGQGLRLSRPRRRAFLDALAGYLGEVLQ